jgi:hypothetical protein
MHPIYITAAVTTTIACCAFGAMLRQLSPPRYQRYLVGVWAGGLFMSPTAYYLVREPVLLHSLTAWLDFQRAQGGWNQVASDIVRLTYAPVTEEPAKLLPWLMGLAIGWPLVAAKKRVVPIACAVGFAFATGEMWLVARFVAEANDPQLRALPWYAFGGYVSERLQTCVTHSLFALPSVYLSRRGWRGTMVGVAIGMTLHFLGNAPIMLMRRDVGNLGPAAWGMLVQLWIVGFSIVGVMALAGVHLGASVTRRVLRRRMICPECGAEYRQPVIFALNAGKWRYEPCGACRKWHWVSFENLAPLPEKMPEKTRGSN